MQNAYYQTFDGGSFTFSNLLTSLNGLNPGASGNGLASMLLGFGSGGHPDGFRASIAVLAVPGILCPGHMAGHNKLTVNRGLRWEIPGVWKERYNRVASFNPHELNPDLAKRNHGEWPAHLWRAWISWTTPRTSP